LNKKQVNKTKFCTILDKYVLNVSFKSELLPISGDLGHELWNNSITRQNHRDSASPRTACIKAIPKAIEPARSFKIANHKP